jgi:hypothetical protein
MTTQRQRTLHGNLPATRAEKQQAADKYPARRFPIQHEIQKLQKELNAFNERIEELENEGHRGHAMEVLGRAHLAKTLSEKIQRVHAHFIASHHRRS